MSNLRSLAPNPVGGGLMIRQFQPHPLAAELEADEAIIEARLLSSPVAHADESGARVAGKLHWIHNFVTEREGANQIVAKGWSSDASLLIRCLGPLYSESSLAQHYEGILVHDCWRSYFGLGGSRPRLVRRAPIARVERTGGAPTTPMGRLLELMDQYQDQVLHFARVEQVPFTNNVAERDIRPWKTKLKVSGCFRTIEGAQQFARIKGFCNTAKEHGLSVFEELVNAITGESFLRNMRMAT